MARPTVTGTCKRAHIAAGGARVTSCGSGRRPSQGAGPKRRIALPFPWEPFRCPSRSSAPGARRKSAPLVEAGVRAGLGERTRRDPWTVSLVKFGSGWSVTLDGPTMKGRRTSFMVPGPAGPQAVAEAVRSAADPPRARRASGAAASAGPLPVGPRGPPRHPQVRHVRRPVRASSTRRSRTSRWKTRPWPVPTAGRS